MSNPVPIYSQVLPKSQQQRGYKQPSANSQPSGQPSRVIANPRYDPRTPQPVVFDPGFDPLNHNHGGNFMQFNVNQNPEAYSRVEKFARESARRSARETGSSRIEGGSRIGGMRREKQINSYVRQAEHRINLRSLSLNETNSSKVHSYNDKTPTDCNSRKKNNSRDLNPISKEIFNAHQFPGSYKEAMHSNKSSKNPFIPYRDSPRETKELYSGNKDLHYSNGRLRDGTKDSVGRDAIYENDGGVRGYNLQAEILVPDSGNKIHSVKRSSSSNKVTSGSSGVNEKRKFYCREWVFQKMAHCLEQRPVSKTCGALVLGDSGSGKTSLCRELSQPGQGPAARQQRALQRRMLARHFLQGQNENSLTMAEFIRTLVMQILNHSTQHRQSINKSTSPRDLNATEVNLGRQISEIDEEDKTNEDINSIEPSAPTLEQIENEFGTQKNMSATNSLQHCRKTMERIHEKDQYNDLLLENNEDKLFEEDAPIQRPSRIINTNPFLPNFDRQLDKEYKLYENHENLFLRNVSQHPKDLKNSRLHRQQSEPPVCNKKPAAIQKSLSTDSKSSSKAISDTEQDSPELLPKMYNKEFPDCKPSTICDELKTDISEMKLSKQKTSNIVDDKNREQVENKELKLPLSPGGSNMNTGKVSRIPVASFKYPNVSGLSSNENSPSKLSNRSLRDGHRSSASDNSDNKEANIKINNENKQNVLNVYEDKQNDFLKDQKCESVELPEYQNILKPQNKKLSPKTGNNEDYQFDKQDFEEILNNPSLDVNVDKTKSLTQNPLFMKVPEKNNFDVSPSKLFDHINDDVPPPIPSLPINPRTLIANCYYEKLLSEPEIQQSLLPHNLEKNPDDCFKKAILFPLLEIDPPKQCLFLLVDSIDENPLIGSGSTSTLTKDREKSGSESSNLGIRNTNCSKSIAELLANHHHLFPQWLLLVCTARKQSKYLTKMFTGFRKISLDDQRKHHATLDVQRYILARLDNEPRLRQHVSRDAAQALDHLRIKSNGCFLYLERVLDGLADGSVALREIREIPGTLNGLYLWLCQRLFHGRKFAKVQPLLNVLLAAKCGVDVEMLYKCLLTTNYTITREDFNKRLHLLKRILTLDTSSGVLSIFHHSFSEWLLDVKHCTRRFLCNALSGHAALAMYYTLRAPRLTPVEIHNLVLHMTRLEQHNNFTKHSKSITDANIDQNVEKGIKPSSTYSNLKSKSDGNLFDYHSLVLLWILDSGCKIETSLKRQYDQIGKDLGGLYLEAHQNTGFEIGHSEIANINLPISAGGLDNVAVHNISHSSGLSNVAKNICEIPDFLTSFYWPTMPRDTKVLRTLLEMGAQVELWPQSTSMGPEDQSLNKAEDTEAERTEGDTSFDIRASQISLEHLLMLEADEAAEEAACIQEEAISLFDIDPLSGRAPIHLLAQNGDVHALKLALEAHEVAGVSKDLLELEDRAGQTALQLAARAGRRNVVALLLSKNTRADRADAEGWTPLRAAAWGGHTEVVELLLNHGCEVDCVDSDHRTALRAAAWSGHEEIVKLLLTHGADVNKTDLEGRTALIAAAYMGHTEIVNHLLDHGADIDHADSDGRTALAVAALCSAGGGVNRGGCVQLLLERGAAAAHPDKDGMTPLLVAAFEGHKEVIELLLEADADPEVADKAGRTPLWAAAAAGHATAVRALLFWGCCVDTIDQDGRTVLSVAAAQGSAEVVRQLVDRGLDEHHRDNAGWTPLHYAAFEGHMEVCEILLEAGAKVDETDNDGKGPLMLAAQEGHCRLIEFLIDEWSAPIDQHSHDGKTALRVAALEGHYDAVRTLIERNADVNALDADQRSTLYILALDNRVTMARYLIEKANADVETRDSEGRTPLHVSAWQGHYEMVNLLLTIGNSNIDARDSERRTPLHSASWRGQAAVVRLLLSNRADPNAQCDQGATPLGIASQEGHEECVLWLLQHGANPKHSDHCGRTPAKVALRAGHLHVCRLLERWGATPPTLSSLQPDVGTNTSESTAETKACLALLSNTRLSPLPISSHIQTKDCSPDSKRRSVHSSNSTKSSSNLTTSTVSSHQEVAPPAPPHSRLPCPPDPVVETNVPPNRGNLALSFAQQVVRCGRRTSRGQVENTSGVMSPLYATPPHSPLSDICSPTQPQQPTNVSAFDRHFCRDTHMRIILGRENKHSSVISDQRERQRMSIVALGNTAGAARLSCRKLVGSIGKIARRKKTTSPIVTGKSKRNGIVTNPAMRLVANVRNGLDTAAANLRRTGVALAASASSNNPAVKTNAFQWKRETPL